MSRSDADRVADMLQACDEIATITQRGRVAFDDDLALRRAVERCLEILGEAAKAVSEPMSAAHPEIPWSDLAKVRDRLSHHYHRVDREQLCTIATQDVPGVAAALRAMGPEV